MSVLDYLRSKITYPTSLNSSSASTSSLICPYCGGSELVFDSVRGEYICTKCGTVVSEHFVVTEQPEYRVFDFDEKSIAKMHYAVAFVPGSITDDVELSRRITKTYNTLERACLVLARYCIAYGKLYDYPMYAIKTAIMYATVAYKNYVLGKVRLDFRLEIEVLAKASLYVSAIRHGLVLHAEKIASGTTIHLKRYSRWKFWRTVKFVAQCNNVKLVATRDSVVTQLIHEYANKLAHELKKHNVAIDVREVTALAVELYKQTKHLFSGFATRTIAATCLYIAAALYCRDVTQKVIMNVTRVTDVAIRNCYRKVMENARIIIYV